MSQGKVARGDALSVAQQVRTSRARQPLVAVSTDVCELYKYLWHAAPQQYLEAAVAGAGVFPLMVPSFGERLDFDQLFGAVDGVIITGSGSNVHPSLYGGDASQANGPYDPARDSTTLPLIRRAIDLGVPLLAICRGLQEMNVALGGTLAVEIQDRPGALDHRAPPGERRDEQFAIRQALTVKPGGCLSDVLGAGKIKVNSLHRQAIDVLGTQLEVEAVAEDGTVEAVSVRNARGFALGVQWHPEYWVRSDEASARIFRAFGDAVRAHKAARIGMSAAPECSGVDEWFGGVRLTLQHNYDEELADRSGSDISRLMSISSKSCSLAEAVKMELGHASPNLHSGSSSPPFTMTTHRNDLMTKPPLFPPPFPIDEYRSRLAALRSAMAERRVDLLIVDQAEHRAYFSGFWSTAAMYQALLIPLDQEPIAVIRGLDAPCFSEASRYSDCVAFADSENPIQVVAETIKARGFAASVIGIERDSHFLTVNRALELESRLPNGRMVDFSRLMWEMRLVKSPLELACLEVAAEICDRAAAAAFDAAQVGINEREVFAAMTSEAWRSGADNAQVAVISSGPSTSFHSSLSGRVLEKGDIVFVEPAPHFRNYTARMMRPKAIGAPTDEQVRTAETMIRIQDEQFRTMRPGVHARNVDRVVREGMLAAGLRDSYTGITGYTLGLKCPPRTSDFTRVFLADSDWQLEENQVFHMYTSARGLPFSETVVVTPEGGKRLTKTDRKLFY
ncbi:M24 family metallopeptidase [Sinorhizobium meliloti]|nr:M24 family metallopeptidase [Sinorhizobium meliloti]